MGLIYQFCHILSYYIILQGNGINCVLLNMPFIVHNGGAPKCGWLNKDN